ncbi:hypothetical protein F0562_023962 [Nyssa sinensis]|uniref:H15 domain-containing protein n=1 Tax=Nyssa sinensis TaxID=561372 RepID=A0A5J5BKN9_9ASTE|nr:hypothetical protein F0562_023962 [Nyssa sinensis]
MDPSPDLPAIVEPAVHTAPAANPTPSHGPNHNHDHPPYAEMITAAITALKDKNGSSRQAIAKYIEKAYPNLPPTHSALLTHHLKRLKNNGHLAMVKHSYMLPRSVPLPSPPANASSFSGPKRRPGRPPKPKPESEPNVGTEPTSAPEAMFVSLGLVDEPMPAMTKKGRGRPPKVKTGSESGGPTSVKKGRGRPPRPKSLSALMGQGRLKRRPGRPPRTGPSSAPGSVQVPRGRPKKDASTVMAPGKPRGRPRKSIGAAVTVGGGGPLLVPIGGGANGVLSVKRGRPKNVGGVKKPRKLTGRPLGRPKKNVSAIIDVSAQQLQLQLQQQMMEFEDLKGKVGHFQSRVKQVVSVVKPHLNPETAASAFVALHELEMLATLNVSPPLHVQSQEQPLQSQEELLLQN